MKGSVGLGRGNREQASLGSQTDLGMNLIQPFSILLHTCVLLCWDHVDSM